MPNYRRYFAGQVISVSGNWMQTVAEMWLIVQLTGSGAAVGLTAGLQFVPILLFGAWGGLLADRLPKRRLLMVTQALMALPALTLFALTAAGSVTPVSSGRSSSPAARSTRSTTRRARASSSSSWGPSAWSTRSR